MTIDEPAHLPRAGLGVELHESEGRSVFARVHESSDDVVTVALSASAAFAVTTRPGEQVDVVWPASDGAMVLPTRLVDSTGESQLHLWTLTPTGPVSFEQRRRQPRAPADGPIVLTVIPGSDDEAHAEPLHGQLVDVSGAALQCIVSADANDVVVVSGSPVRVDFALDLKPVSLRGIVHAAWTVDGLPRIRVVVVFDPDQPDTGVVERFVTAQPAPPEPHLPTSPDTSPSPPQ